MCTVNAGSLQNRPEDQLGTRKLCILIPIKLKPILYRNCNRCANSKIVKLYVGMICNRMTLAGYITGMRDRRNDPSTSSKNNENIIRCGFCLCCPENSLLLSQIAVERHIIRAIYISKTEHILSLFFSESIFFFVCVKINAIHVCTLQQCEIKTIRTRIVRHFRNNNYLRSLVNNQSHSMLEIIVCHYFQSNSVYSIHGTESVQNK